MTERRKKLLKWVGYPLLAWTTFIFAAHFTFPYERLRDRVVEALSKEFDVSIASVSPGWLPGRVTIEVLSLTTRPRRDDEKPKTLIIERVDLALGMLALLGRTVSVDVDAKLGGGRLVGNVDASSAAVVLDLRTEDVSLESVPGLDAITGGAPIVGPFVAKLKLSLPKGKFAAAGGGLEVSCSGCTIGDGVTKVRPMSPGQQNAFTSEGMTLPRIRLGEFSGKIPITKGVACIERFEARGGDIELTLEGGVKFADPFRDTQAMLQARLKSSEEFKRASVRNSALFTGVRDGEGFVTYVARNAPLVALRWLESRSPFQPMAECRGVAAPPSPAAAAKPPVASRTVTPAVPPAPVGTATPNGRTGDTVIGAPTTTPPPAAAVPDSAPAAAPPPPEPPEPPPPAPTPGNDLQPSAAPAPGPPTEPPAAPPPAQEAPPVEITPPPAVEAAPPPVQEQPLPAPAPPAQ